MECFNRTDGSSSAGLWIQFRACVGPAIGCGFPPEMDPQGSKPSPIPPTPVHATSPRRRRSGWVQRSKRWFNKIPDRLAERKLNAYQVVVMVLVCYAVYRFVIPMFDRDFGGGGGGGEAG